MVQRTKRLFSVRPDTSHAPRRFGAALITGIMALTGLGSAANAQPAADTQPAAASTTHDSEAHYASAIDLERKGLYAGAFAEYLRAGRPLEAEAMAEHLNKGFCYWVLKAYYSDKNDLDGIAKMNELGRALPGFESQQVLEGDPELALIQLKMILQGIPASDCPQVSTAFECEIALGKDAESVGHYTYAANQYLLAGRVDLVTGMLDSAGTAVTASERDSILRAAAAHLLQAGREKAADQATASDDSTTSPPLALPLAAGGKPVTKVVPGPSEQPAEPEATSELPDGYGLSAHRLSVIPGEAGLLTYGMRSKKTKFALSYMRLNAMTTENTWSADGYANGTTSYTNTNSDVVDVIVGYDWLVGVFGHQIFSFKSGFQSGDAFFESLPYERRFLLGLGTVNPFFDSETVDLYLEGRMSIPYVSEWNLNVTGGESQGFYPNPGRSLPTFTGKLAIVWDDTATPLALHIQGSTDSREPAFVLFDIGVPIPTPTILPTFISASANLYRPQVPNADRNAFVTANYAIASVNVTYPLLAPLEDLWLGASAGYELNTFGGNAKSSLPVSLAVFLAKYGRFNIGADPIQKGVVASVTIAVPFYDPDDVSVSQYFVMGSIPNLSGVFVPSDTASLSRGTFSAGWQQ